MTQGRTAAEAAWDRELSWRWMAIVTVQGAAAASLLTIPQWHIAAVRVDMALAWAAAAVCGAMWGWRYRRARRLSAAEGARAL